MKWEEIDHDKLFEMLPEAESMAVGEDGRVYWGKEKQHIVDKHWHTSNSPSYYIGTYSCDDWTKSLRVRKWKPKINEEYWFISSGIKALRDVNHKFEIDNDRLVVGNCSRTEEDCERMIEKVKEILNA